MRASSSGRRRHRPPVARQLSRGFWKAARKRCPSSLQTPMGQAAGWAMGLLMSCPLWHLGWSQRPGWYYGDVEAPFGKTLDASQVPAGFTLNAQELLWYSYWVVIGMLVVIIVSSVGLFLQQFLRAQQKPGKAETPSQPGDPEEDALVEALHLLDAVMEKTWQYLHRLERRRRRSRRGT